jgi:ribosomal protein S27E
MLATNQVKRLRSRADAAIGTQPERAVSDQIIRIRCPNLLCRRMLAVPSNARGKVVACRGCGMKIQIPQPGVRPTAEESAKEEQNSGQSAA